MLLKKSVANSFFEVQQTNGLKLLEIVDGIKKVFIPSGIKHVEKKLYKAKFKVLVFLPLSKSPSFWTVWRPSLY